MQEGWSGNKSKEQYQNVMDVKSAPASFFVSCNVAWHEKGQRSRRAEEDCVNPRMKDQLHDCSSPWSYTTVTNMALLNTSFQKQENSSKTGLLWELCYLSRAWSMKSGLWGENGSSRLMALMKSISYQTQNAIFLSNKINWIFMWRAQTLALLSLFLAPNTQRVACNTGQLNVV